MAVFDFQPPTPLGKPVWHPTDTTAKLSGDPQHASAIPGFHGQQNLQNGLGSRAPVPTQSVRVLFAEDSPEQQMLIKYYMNAFPCMVEFANDGLEVLDKCQRYAFPFIFMDMRMPKMDGLTATQAIRRMESDQNRLPARIIALTGMCRDSDLKAIRQAGCDGILSKPYTKLQFMRKIKEILHIP
ncbi:CheY-like chemotaxis protein [Nitrospina gracilis]|nr:MULTISPECIES: response regulator [Nitrospina]MCF8722954.1 CheY-like chemotaxis protein [Nitrospina sp. Nb-3]